MRHVTRDTMQLPEMAPEKTLEHVKIPKIVLLLDIIYLLNMVFGVLYPIVNDIRGQIQLYRLFLSIWFGEN